MRRPKPVQKPVKALPQIGDFIVRDAWDGKCGAQVTALMAADLIRLDAFHSEADAIRALMALKLYSTFEIMSYVEKAIYDAQQETVAQMMSDRPGCARK